MLSRMSTGRLTKLTVGGDEEPLTNCGSKDVMDSYIDSHASDPYSSKITLKQGSLNDYSKLSPVHDNTTYLLNHFLLFIDPKNFECYQYLLNFEILYKIRKRNISNTLFFKNQKRRDSQTKSRFFFVCNFLST